MSEKTETRVGESKAERALSALIGCRLPLPEDAPWWWLSFADDNGFRGLVVARGVDFLDVVARTHVANINPGGECAGVEIPPDILPTIAAKWRDRLLTKDEAQALAAESDAMVEQNEKETK